MNWKKQVLTLILLSLLLATAVSAQATNIFESISGIFGGQDFGTLYGQYWWIIDMIVYLFFFGYIGKLTMGQQFQGKGGGLGIVVGVALSIAVVFFESTSGFRLGNIGPFGLAVALVIFGIVVWRFFKGMGFGGGTSAAWMFVFIYGFALTIASPLFKWIDNQEGWWWDTIVGLLNLFLLIAIIAIVAQLRQFFKGSGSKLGGGLGDIISKAGSDVRATERADVQGDIKEMGREKQDIGDVARAGFDEGSVANIFKNELQNMEAIKNFMTQLQGIAPRLTREQTKAIAKARAKALRDAINKLLEFSKRAKKSNSDAESRMKRVINRLGKELKDRSKMEAKDAKAKAEKGQKQATYDNIIQQRNQQIDARLRQIKLEAFQGERAEGSIQNTIQQVTQAEEQIKGEVETLIKDLESGNIYAIEQVTTNILRGVEGAEQALAGAERLALGTRNYAADLRQKFFRTETTVKQEAMTSEYELTTSMAAGGQLKMF